MRVTLGIWVVMADRQVLKAKGLALGTTLCTSFLQKSSSTPYEMEGTCKSGLSTLRCLLLPWQICMETASICFSFWNHCALSIIAQQPSLASISHEMIMLQFFIVRTEEHLKTGENFFWSSFYVHTRRRKATKKPRSLVHMPLNTQSCPHASKLWFSLTPK